MHYAILDLGSNTFNLLITKLENKNFLILEEIKLPVKISEDAFINNLLTDKAMQRGVKAIQQHIDATKKYPNISILGFATSAIRSTKNGKSFIEKLNKKFNLNIQIISGLQEAQTIYAGVIKAINFSDPFLMCDIGGGSTEIAIANKQNINFIKSYDLGVARIKSMFNPSYPLSKEKIDEIKNYYLSQIKDLIESLKMHPTTTIVGSAGTFDSLVQMVELNSIDKIEKNKTSAKVSRLAFYQIYSALLPLNLQELKRFAGLPAFRAEFIILGFIFIDTLLDITGSTQIIQSNYSLKEGFIFQLQQTKQHE